MISTDIDIDVADRDQILSGLNIINASILNKNGEYTKHPSGVYFTDIPKNPYTNLSTVPYDVAEDLGYFKIDILNNSLYHGIKSELHLIELMNKEPRWDLLGYKEFTDNLHQLNKHHKLLNKLKPSSVEELAMILAIIRPAKSHLQNQPWDEIKKYVWEKDEDGSYQFKKSHAISYAVSIVVQMNLIMEELEVSNQ